MALIYPVQQPTRSAPYPNRLVSGIQSQLLEVTVTGCSKLKNPEWNSRHDPYVILEYGSTKFRTRTCADGGKNPTFQDKTNFTLMEGIEEVNIGVWNSNTLTCDDFLGGVTIKLQKVLTKGYHNSTWPLHSNDGRSSGEVHLVLIYVNAKKQTQATNFAASAPPYSAPAAPQVPLYFGALPPSPAATYPTAAPYLAPSPYPSLYLPNPAAYPPNPYALPPRPAAYPPQPYQLVAYLPQPYPPCPQATPYYSPGPYPGYIA